MNLIKALRLVLFLVAMVAWVTGLAHPTWDAGWPANLRAAVVWSALASVWILNLWFPLHDLPRIKRGARIGLTVSYLCLAAFWIGTVPGGPLAFVPEWVGMSVAAVAGVFWIGYVLRAFISEIRIKREPMRPPVTDF